MDRAPTSDRYRPSEARSRPATVGLEPPLGVRREAMVSPEEMLL